MPNDALTFRNPGILPAPLPTALRRLAGKVLSLASLLRRRRPVLRPGDLSDHLRADLGLERWRGWKRPPRGPI